MHNFRKKLQQSSKFKNKMNHLYNKLNEHNLCICADQNGVMDMKHIETVRIISNRRIKKIGGKLIIKVKPSIPITKKSTGVRMGKGKGPFKNMVFYSKVDQILFEFKNVPLDLFLIIFKKIKHKLPIKIKILT